MASNTTEVSKPEDANAVPWRLPRPSIDPVYEFNAPQFHDFTNARDDPIAAESYFEDGRRVTICKPRITTTGELALILEAESISEEGRSESKSGDVSENQSPASKCQQDGPQPITKMPESPGLRVPTHSVLDTERLGMSEGQSQIGKKENQIPGFMRSRKTGTNKDRVKPEPSGRIKAKTKKSVMLVPPSEGKFGLEGSRHPLPKSSEELELEKIRNEMQAAAALREKNKARMLQASVSEGIASVPKRTSRKSTIPKPFAFIKDSARAEPGKILRSSHSAAELPINDRGRSRTRSEKIRSPNHSFAGPRSRSRSLSVNSLRVQPEKTCSGSVPFTPLSVQTGSYFAHRSESRSRERSLPVRTLPQEFHLSTPRRSVSKILSTEEKELLEIKQHSQFKARKMPKKILQSTGDVGVPRIHKKSATVTEAFSFATSKRSSTARPKSASTFDTEEFHQFKARPVPQAVLKPTPRRPQTAPSRSTTIPKSPRISKPKLRAVSPVKIEPEPVFHARPMPDFSRTPKMPLVSARAPTQPEPFPLKTEERGIIKQQQFKRQLSAEEKASENLRIYKAKPLIFASPMKIQHGPVLVTEPKPFSLKSEEISKKIKESLHKRLEEEREKENELFSSFKARVPLHTVKEPFVPLSVHHEPIVPEPFHLVSEERAVKRANFDRQVDQQHREAEAAREARRRDKEKAELESLMASLDLVAFKARPFKMTSGFQIVKSRLPLTSPMSPEFATDKRLKKVTAVKAA